MCLMMSCVIVCDVDECACVCDGVCVMLDDRLGMMSDCLDAVRQSDCLMIISLIVCPSDEEEVAAVIRVDLRTSDMPMIP